MSIYQDIILDHYRNPRNFGRLDHATHRATVNNPLCGDEISIMLQIGNDKVDEVKFLGEGCAISTAASSILTDQIKGMKIADLIKLDKTFMMKLIGIEIGPNRLKCLLLPLEALHEAGKF